MSNASSEVRHVVAWLQPMRWVTGVALWSVIALVWLFPHLDLSLRGIRVFGLTAALLTRLSRSLRFRQGASGGCGVSRPAGARDARPWVRGDWPKETRRDHCHPGSGGRAAHRERHPRRSRVDRQGGWPPRDRTDRARFFSGRNRRRHPSASTMEVVVTGRSAAIAAGLQNSSTTNVATTPPSRPFSSS